MINSFRQFLEATAAPPPEPIDISEPAGPPSVKKSKTETKWKLTKDQIIAHWQALRPDEPIKMRPLPHDFEGETYSKDGIRITGSRAFIDSIICRLKELMTYENPHVRLNLIYRMQPKERQDPNSPPSFVCYIQSEVRAPRRKKHKISGLAPIAPLTSL